MVAVPSELGVEQIEIILHQPKRPKIMITKNNILPIILPPINNPPPQQQPIDIHIRHSILNIIHITAIPNINLHTHIPPRTQIPIPLPHTATRSDNNRPQLPYKLDIIVRGYLLEVELGCIGEAVAVVGVL